MFVVHFDTLLGEDRHVADIIPVAVIKFMKMDGIVKFFDLGLVGFLPKPRDAFCGGRTNAIELYHQTEADYDFTLLYPYVNKTKRYPLGQPEILFEPGHTDMSQYFGIAKCTVLPPYELYHHTR